MKTVEYDNHSNTLYYYKCEMYAEGVRYDYTYHRTYSAAMNMGEYWCSLCSEDNRDYTVEEIEIEFHE